MARRSRARAPRGIRGRRRNRQPRRLNQSSRIRVKRQPDCDRVEPAAGFARHSLALWQNHGERPRPEGRRKPPGTLRDVPHQRLHLFDAGNVDNQRIVARPSLCRVDFFRRRSAQCVAAESVDGLGRERDQTAVAKDLSGARQGFLSLLRTSGQQTIDCLHAQRRPSCSFSTWLRRL